jgi:hypothetical protein
VIKLSVLLPTYNFPLGVNLILKKILSEKNFINEVIISDNSKNKSVYYVFQKFKTILNIKYVHKMPTTIPQQNWKFLIDKSECDYFIILHHDDVPVEKFFFKKIHQLINFYNKPDVLSINTYINDNSILNNRIHTHALLRKIILKYFFNYIIFRNIIGPLSSLIIKKKNIKYFFDNRLKWMIDVKFYNQYLKASSIIVTDLISIKSLLFNKESLSLKIKDKFIIQFKEKKYISKKFFFLYSTFDFLFWYSYRIFSYGSLLIKNILIKVKKKIRD